MKVQWLSAFCKMRSKLLELGIKIFLQIKFHLLFSYYIYNYSYPTKKTQFKLISQMYSCLYPLVYTVFLVNSLISPLTGNPQSVTAQIKILHHPWCVSVTWVPSEMNQWWNSVTDCLCEPQVFIYYKGIILPIIQDSFGDHRQYF